MSGGCAVLFGLPFIIAGIAFGASLYFPAIASWWSARGWEEVPCWIETAELQKSRGNKGGWTFKAVAGYRYEFDRRTYHGSEVSLVGGSDNMGHFQENAFQQIQEFKGKSRPFRCFVNPAHPEQAALFRDLRWGTLLLLSIFPTFFPLAGGAVSVNGWLQSRKARQRARLSAQHPGAPWRWRPEWAGETLHASPDAWPFILAVAAWILIVQLPLALAVIVGGEVAKSPLALLALLPAALGLIPLRFVWRRIKSRRILGPPALQLRQLPISPGRPLAGELRFDRAPSSMGAVSVRVLCQRHITRSSGDSRTTAKETIWEHTESLSTALARRDLDGMALPLRIDIPRGLPCSAIDEASIVTTDGEEHVWTLEVSSSQAGRPVVLPLPVFASHEPVDSAESTAHQPVEVILLSSGDLVPRLKARGIHAEFDASGAPVLIDCPAGRFRGLGIFLLFFGAFWSAAFMFMTYEGAPLLFRLFWGVTSPLIIGAGLWTLLYSRRVEIAGGRLRILNRIGPFYSWNETYEARQFTNFMHDTNMQSGNQFYYRVRAETIFGKKKTLIDGITESLTAETLAHRLEAWGKRER